ncbi:MAG: ankyrin repeat domain-containing protein, partial [Gammaproteobacteria bacterium]|nr:ankyrin repeat domain-containing protein [Gammaproteobacteria bacterium]
IVAAEIVAAHHEGTLPRAITEASAYQELIARLQDAQRAEDDTMRRINDTYQVAGAIDELIGRYQNSKVPQEIEICKQLEGVKRQQKEATEALYTFCQEEATYNEFVHSYHSSNGQKWLTLLINQEGGLVDAIAKLRGLEVCFWQKTVGNSLRMVHLYGDPNHATQILHTDGTHFDLLETTKVEDVAEADDPAPIPARDHIAVVEHLLDTGADLEKSDAKGDTPLLHAVRTGNQQLAELFIGHKANLETKDKDGNTALHLALTMGHFGLAARLINSGANLETTNPAGDTVLLHAVRLQRPELIELALAKQANKEAKDTAGNTALLLAAGLPNQQTVELLMVAGANAKATNAAGKKPAEIARDAGNHKLAAFIETERNRLRVAPFLEPLQRELDRQKTKAQKRKQEIRGLKTELEATKLQKPSDIAGITHLTLGNFDDYKHEKMVYFLTKYPSIKQVTMKDLSLYLEHDGIGRKSRMKCWCPLNTRRLLYGAGLRIEKAASNHNPQVFHKNVTNGISFHSLPGITLDLRFRKLLRTHASIQITEDKVVLKLHNIEGHLAIGCLGECHKFLFHTLFSSEETQINYGDNGLILISQSKQTLDEIVEMFKALQTPMPQQQAAYVATSCSLFKATPKAEKTEQVLGGDQQPQAEPLKR